MREKKPCRNLIISKYHNSINFWIFSGVFSHLRKWIVEKCKKLLLFWYHLFESWNARKSELFKNWNFNLKTWTLILFCGNYSCISDKMIELLECVYVSGSWRQLELSGFIFIVYHVISLVLLDTEKGRRERGGEEGKRASKTIDWFHFATM